MIPDRELYQSKNLFASFFSLVLLFTNRKKISSDKTANTSEARITDLGCTNCGVKDLTFKTEGPCPFCNHLDNHLDKHPSAK